MTRAGVVSGGAIACLVCFSIAMPTKANPLDAGPSDRVALDVPKDAAIIVLGTGVALAPLVFPSALAPSSCRWCDGTAGSSVNPVDDWFHQHLTASVLSRNTSNTVSSVLAFAAMPAFALGSTWFATGPHATEGAGVRNVVIVAESVAAAEAVTQFVKYTAARQRPYAHYENVASAPGSELPTLTSDSQRSFPSGHTSLAAAAGTSAAMLATLEESSAAPWLWATTAAVTVATGTLRMTSESHYFSDVLAGLAIGTGCGVLFPLLHRRGSLLSGGTVPVFAAGDGGGALGLAGVF